MYFKQCTYFDDFLHSRRSQYVVHLWVASLVNNGAMTGENEVWHRRHAHSQHPVATRELRASTTGWNLPNVHTEIIRSRDNVLHEGRQEKKIIHSLLHLWRQLHCGYMHHVLASFPCSYTHSTAANWESHEYRGRGHCAIAHDFKCAISIHHTHFGSNHTHIFGVLGRKYFAYMPTGLRMHAKVSYDSSFLKFHLVYRH